jgi:hypothetical protein
MNFTIFYEGRHLEVNGRNKNGKTVYEVDFPSGLVVYEPVSHHGQNKLWLQGGRTSPMATVIGTLIEEKLVVY